MNLRACGLVVLLAGLAFAPASRGATPASPHTQAAPLQHAGQPAKQATAMQRLRPIALSYRAQYLAWITPQAGKDVVMLASWRGNNPHALAIPAACSATDIRWAPNWNTLAILARCQPGPASGGAAHDAIWTLDVHAGTPPARIAELDGRVRCMQWTADGKHIAFLQASGSTSQRTGGAGCNVRRTMRAAPAGQTQRVAIVSTSGGAAQAITPASRHVYAFATSPWGKRIVYAAAGNGAGTRLYVQAARPGAAARLIVDTASSAGSLRGKTIAQPRFSPNGARIVFFGGALDAHDLQGRNLYGAPASGGTATLLTGAKGSKVSWFRFLGNHSLLATKIAHGKVEVATWRLSAGFTRQTALWFSVPDRIGNGRHLLAVAYAGAASGHPTIAYVQISTDGSSSVHSGVMNLSPAPVVATIPSAPTRLSVP